MPEMESWIGGMHIMGKEHLSRRGFLKGAGISALGVAGAGLLVGCKRSEIAVSGDVEASDDGTDWLGTAPEIADPWCLQLRCPASSWCGNRCSEDGSSVSDAHFLVSERAVV